MLCISNILHIKINLVQIWFGMENVYCRVKLVSLDLSLLIYLEID